MIGLGFSKWLAGAFLIPESSPETKALRSVRSGTLVSRMDLTPEIKEIDPAQQPREPASGRNLLSGLLSIDQAPAIEPRGCSSSWNGQCVSEPHFGLPLNDSRRWLKKAYFKFDLGVKYLTL
jgi:hypothetical protein